MAKFNFINAINNSNSVYTKDDIKSERVEETAEKVDIYSASDLTEVLNSRNENLGKAFNFKLIPREKIAFNKNNDFEMLDIEELAASILENGLLHNLITLYNSDEDIYYLESGERRLRACDYLRDKFEKFKDNSSREYKLYIENINDFYISGFPVNIKKQVYQDDPALSSLDKINSELRKYRANMDVREFTPQEKAKYIEKIKSLISDKNAILYKDEKKELLPEVEAKDIAQVLGLSERQYAKYEAIAGLIPELKEEFENGNLSINKVPGISRLPKEEQEIVLEFIKKGNSIELEQVKEFSNRIKSLEKEKLEAEEEKSKLLEIREKLESELEAIRDDYQKDKDSILEEIAKREKELKTELEKSIIEDNKEKIDKLQLALQEEKNTASRIKIDNEKKLERARNEIEIANERIKELEEQKKREATSDKVLEIKNSIDINIKFLDSLYRKIQEEILSLSEDISKEELISIKNKIRRISEEFLKK